MAYNYTPIYNTAKRLIDKFGREIQRRILTNSGDAWNPIQTAIDTNIIGAFTSFSNNEIDGTLILSTDKKILTYIEVAVADKIIDGNIIYSVINVDVVQVGLPKIIYKVQVRI